MTSGRKWDLGCLVVVWCIAIAGAVSAVDIIWRRAAFGPHIDLAKTNDHIVPVSRGGKRTVPACYFCNRLKSDMEPEVWEFFMQENPSWWLLSKGELRRARRHAIRMTARLKETSIAVGPPLGDDWKVLREHWIFVAKLVKCSHVIQGSTTINGL